MTWHDKLIDGIARNEEREWIESRRTARLREARAWGVDGMIGVIALWCIVHWSRT